VFLRNASNAAFTNTMIRRMAKAARFARATGWRLVFTSRLARRIILSAF
jgi:hypothetical protein